MTMMIRKLCEIWTYAVFHRQRHSRFQAAPLLLNSTHQHLFSSHSGKKEGEGTGKDEKKPQNQQHHQHEEEAKDHRTIKKHPQAPAAEGSEEYGQINVVMGIRVRRRGPRDPSPGNDNPGQIHGEEDT